eukprot:365185-Chlamydomonas_euryale.AAC.1
MTSDELYHSNLRGLKLKFDSDVIQRPVDSAGVAKVPRSSWHASVYTLQTAPPLRGASYAILGRPGCVFDCPGVSPRIPARPRPRRLNTTPCCVALPSDRFAQCYMMLTDAFLHLNRPEMSAGSGPSSASCVCLSIPGAGSRVLACPAVACG